MPNGLTPLLSRYRHLIQVLASLARNSHRVEAVVQAVHEQIGRLFPGHATLLALLQPEGDWLWELYEGKRRYTQRLPFYPDGVIESVLHGEALSIPDIYAHLDAHPARVRRLVNDGRVLLDIDGKYGQLGQPALSMVFVPLEIRGERTGVLSIQSYEVGAFDDTDLEFLKLLAQHVSIALENAVLREELGRLTRTDALTGLLNRRAFHHDVPLALAAARRDGLTLSLMMLDVHEFKRINDGFGHQVGDAVLAVLGQVLTQTFPAPDMVFRLSGDEFALLVWGPETRLEDLSNRLTGGLRAADWPPGPGPVCLQGGVAQPPPGAGVEEWLSLADARMYQAKQRRVVGRQVNWGLDFGDGY
ncbi:sensor domain-containing diguanylate cyclase [Deinococcus arenicola]|uniref:Sensor domain-containing diguanylate cyclase n=1 Tax=Deinococcus arenicola TaxID=2994950 RepID=A0ABU4DRQ9_9DEIO|nr:sensor domain-containing diguanylate cyclase [Deinococcus sp. ZS9-10]MDV6375126.1 sensor domain-containing diguanylate cyclase [Deinococcus sp. ZS9-10]